MDQEILNIEHHKCKLLVRALNIHKTRTAAAHILGVSEKNVYRMVRDYQIVYNNSTNQFEAKKPPGYLIFVP